MNDRLKFRVWNEKEKSFIVNHKHPIGSDYFLVLTAEGELVKMGVGDFNKYGQYSWGSIENYKGIIEQCTGLKDKNGRLIYEGDIVRVKNIYLSSDSTQGEVCYGHFYFSPCEEYTCKRLGYFIKCKWFAYAENTGYALGEEREYEIVGNIHENPELIEEQND